MVEKVVDGPVLVQGEPVNVAVAVDWPLVQACKAVLNGLQPLVSSAVTLAVSGLPTVIDEVAVEEQKFVPSVIVTV